MDETQGWIFTEEAHTWMDKYRELSGGSTYRLKGMFSIKDDTQPIIIVDEEIRWEDMNVSWHWRPPTAEEVEMQENPKGRF